MEQCYAVEAYNSAENVYSRYETGSKDDMVKALCHLVSSDVEADKVDSYYRVNPITEKDKQIWDKQVEALPNIPNNERVFGEWTQINAASKYLGVTFGRVFNLVTAGKIHAITTGTRNKLVSVTDVVNRKIDTPPSGRPYKNMKID